MIIKSRIRFKTPVLMMLAALLAGACSGDKPMELEQKPVPGADFQITVVFAPGQLGDKGYADNVMLGVGLLNDNKDSCDVQFISTFDNTDTRKVLKSWAETPVNPFYDGDYKRRLLVLTEYFMIDWLDDIKDDLRADDEVLLLKVNDDDVQHAAAAYGLEGRLHGLNISVAYSVRKFCRSMRWSVENMVELDSSINIRVLPYFRLYDNDVVTYRDSVYETLAQELGDSTDIQVNSILRKTDTGTYSVLMGTSVIQTAYSYAQMMKQAYIEKGYYFAITDLGSGNVGWNYYLFGQNDGIVFEMLMLDTEEVVSMNSQYIFRRWDQAIYRWGKDWMMNEIGQMPRMKLYTNGEMCVDNIFDVDLYEDDEE